MPALNNPKHEAFVQEYAKQLKDPTQEASQTKAYQNVYGCGFDSARSSAPVVLANPSVKNRLIELIDEDEELNDRGIKKHLRDLLVNSKDGVRLGTIQTVMKVKGQLSDGSNSLQQNNIAQVLFNEITVNNGPVDNSTKPQDVVGHGRD